MLFLTAYLVGVLSATGLIVYPSIYGYSFVLSALITVAFLLAFLPCGLVFAVDGILTVLGLDGSGVKTGLILSIGMTLTFADLLPIIFGVVFYLLCFMIPVIGSVTSRQRTFRLFFLAFVILLIISIAGWVTIQ